MAFKAARCPSCSGDLQVPDNRDVVKCMYCGTDIVVREAIKLILGIDVDNLMKLAKNSLDIGNYSEAYEYYLKVLESNVNTPDAWYGKGFAIGNMATITNNGIEEMISNFEKAIDYSDDKEKEIMKEKVSNSITSVCVSLYNLLSNNYSVSQESFFEYLIYCIKIIFVLERAYTFKPTKITLDWILYICNNKLCSNVFREYIQKFSLELQKFN